MKQQLKSFGRGIVVGKEKTKVPRRECSRRQGEELIHSAGV